MVSSMATVISRCSAIKDAFAEVLFDGKKQILLGGQRYGQRNISLLGYCILVHIPETNKSEGLSIYFTQNPPQCKSDA
jgi:hypothetical protein